MKKIYQAPEVECYFVKEFCQQYEGQSEQGGEVTPLGNENSTFEENELPMEVSTNLWDD